MTPSETKPFEDLLVYVDHQPATDAALAFADAIAGDGNIGCLMFGLMAAYPMSIYMEATPSVWLEAQRKAKEAADEAEAKLKARLEKLDHKVEFRRRDVMEGESGRVLGIHGRYADAVIIGWPAKGGGAYERDLFTGALFNSGGPVILVPETHRAAGQPSRVMIGWSATKEAARALRDAMPLLKAAEEVRVVCVDTGGAAAEEDPGADIGRHLARHDVKVHVKQVPAAQRSAGEALMAEAGYMGADLIVMGGYGHSRMAQWIMGGATRDVLGNLPAPTLFSH